MSFRIPRLRALAVPACAVALLMPLSPPARAQDTELFLGADVTDFHYRELDTGGHELDREDGILPGLRFTARATRDLLFVRLDATYHGGAVDYDGETQSGQPVTTTTDTQFFTVAADVGRWFAPPPGAWGGFVHLARRNWNRDIRYGRTPREEYRWSELGLGLRYAWAPARDSSWRHELSGTLLGTTSGSVYVRLSDLNSSYDNTTLDLGDRAGFRLRYTATDKIGQHTLRIEPYVEYWKFGRSNTEAITANGSNTGYVVTEPRSDSTRIGVAVGFVF